MDIEKTSLQTLRKIYRKMTGSHFDGLDWPSSDGWIKANKILKDKFLREGPVFVGRIGTTECAVLINYLTVHSKESYIKKCYNFITDDTRLPKWDFPRLAEDLCTFSGFFTEGSLTIRDIESFAELYLNAIPTMDVCGRFSYPEKFLPFNKDCEMVQLESLYPFWTDEPWIKVFEGKKVLVVHPFKETILSQYNTKRQLLFPNSDWLPEFDLDVIKAVQSIAGEKTPFDNWFQALDYMKEEISKRDFDLLICGCGAYGLPLAAYAKSLGKHAVHLGGGTQLLFGIKGNRWINYHEGDNRFAELFNEHWVFPGENEKPKNAQIVEGGCYWG